MTTVLIVDDQVLIRQAVADILSAHQDIAIIGEASNGAEAIALTAKLRPDVVVMDIRMPGVDGIEATASICADPQNANTRVLILTTFEEDDNVVAALRAGASGFIGKGAEPDEILRSVLAVHAGEALLSPAATRSLIARCVLTPTTRPEISPLVTRELERLTDREREVLLLVASGKSNQEIADELVISPHTAKTHVNRVMVKLAAHDRAQLVIIAYETGLIIPGL